MEKKRKEGEPRKLKGNCVAEISAQRCKNAPTKHISSAGNRDKKQGSLFSAIYFNNKFSMICPYAHCAHSHYAPSELFENIEHDCTKN